MILSLQFADSSWSPEKSTTAPPRIITEPLWPSQGQSKCALTPSPGLFLLSNGFYSPKEKKVQIWYMTLQELLKFASVSNLHPFVPPCHSLHFLSQSTFYYRHFQLPTVLIMPWTSSCSYLQLMLNFFCLVLILNDIFPPPQSLSCFPLHAGYFTQHSRYTSQGIYSVATVGTIFKYRQSPSLKIKVFSHLFFHSLSNSFLPQHLA